ncbi:MAG: type II toxin-antitoxin system Phd/YefM family antitoxin [Anaerolineales bacterium]|nr:MAG: type II toxin-antitoxin system Phd/YefM family antitoxin [Anaerolineales bacterium]
MIERLPVKKVIGATEARKNLSQLLNQVHRREEHLVVEKLGIPVAAIISIRDYEQYQHFLAQRMLKDLGRRVGAEAEKQGLTEEKLFEELDRTRQEIFEERYADLNQ